MFKTQQQHLCNVSALKTYVTSRIFIHASKDSLFSNAADSLRNCDLQPVWGYQIKLDYAPFNSEFHSYYFQSASYPSTMLIDLEIDFQNMIEGRHIPILDNSKSFMQLCCHSLDDFFFLLETSEFWSLQIKKGSPCAQQYNCLQ